jgi:hypothetical protein
MWNIGHETRLGDIDQSDIIDFVAGTALLGCRSGKNDGPVTLELPPESYLDHP